jgi:hypothetical protein
LNSQSRPQRLELGGLLVPANAPASFRPSGLALPPRLLPASLDAAGTFMTVLDYAGKEYAPFGPDRFLEGFDAWRSHLAANSPLPEIVCALAALNRFAHHPEKAGPAVEFMRASLGLAARERFENALKTRELFARQPVLRAIREVLSQPERPAHGQLPTDLAAVLLAHAEAAALSSRRTGPDEQIGGWPVRAVLDLASNWLFHTGDDRWAMVARAATLWRVYGPLAKKHTGGRSAVDLLLAATGLEPEDALALTFALAAHSMEWTPDKAVTLRLDQGIEMDPARVAAFVRFVSGTPADFAAKLSAAARSSWDFTCFETMPVLELPEGFLVLDESLLWDRAAAGLFWAVFDHLKASESDASALAWMKAWGDIVEAAAGDILKHCALRALDGTVMMWDEDDLWAAYGADKAVCDFVLDLGDYLVLFEVVSGRIKTPFRVDLSRAAFDEDIERLITRKARQLGSSARLLLEDESKLTGSRHPAPRRIIPVLVAAMGIPHFEPVILHAREKAGEAGYVVDDARVEPLQVLDLRELEYLEGQAGAGQDAASVLRRWIRDTGGLTSLWGWASTWADSPPVRSRRISAVGVDVANELRRRLRLSGDPDPDAPWEPGSTRSPGVRDVG